MLSGCLTIYLKLQEHLYADKAIQIIHGHFGFSNDHSKIYPNAKKIIWLRDPVERAFSTLNHWMRIKNSVQYNDIISKFPQHNKISSIELFDLVIKESNLNKVLNLYSYYLADAKPREFAFIGHVENYNDDLQRLSILMGFHLPKIKVNQNPNQSIKPTREEYQEYFTSDYDVYDRFMGYKNSK